MLTCTNAENSTFAADSTVTCGEGLTAVLASDDPLGKRKADTCKDEALIKLTGQTCSFSADTGTSNCAPGNYCEDTCKKCKTPTDDSGDEKLGVKQVRCELKNPEIMAVMLRCELKKYLRITLRIR
jgi:hypothetical protein